MSNADARNWDAAKARGVQNLGQRPKESKPRSNEESRSQQFLIKWWQMQCRTFNVPELALAAIPNGGGRSGPVAGAILKREGLRKGFPDLMILAKRGIYGALFLEMKTRDGVLSPEQESYRDILTKQGYKVVVCRSTMEAINQITAYLHQ